MDQKHLSQSYLSNTVLNSSYQELLSAYGNAIRNMIDTHHDGMVDVLKLSSDFFAQSRQTTLATNFQPALKIFTDFLNESLSQSSVSPAKTVIKELIEEIIPSNPQFETADTSDSSTDYVFLDQSAIKEYELPETLAIPIGHNRIKIKFDTLISIIALIVSLFALLKPSAADPEQLALQRTEVQLLSEILENTESSDSDTAKKLDALQESIDELNSHFADIE